MELKENLTAYEQDLVQALWDQTYRRQEESLESLQVFVSNQSVGTLACDTQARAERVFEIKKFLGLIELRSSSGLPVGSLLSDPSRRTTAQFRAGNHLVELEVQSHEDRSVVHLTATNLLVATQKPIAQESSNLGLQGLNPKNSPWSRVALAAQLLLVAGVVFLVADRLFQITNPLSGRNQLVATQEQPLQQVPQQFTAGQNRLDPTPVVTVGNGTDAPQGKPGLEIMNQKEQRQSPVDSMLEKKAVPFEEGLLQSRPIWVRFKKNVEDPRRESFFKEVSAQNYTKMGGWYSFDLNVPSSQSTNEILKPFSERGDIEIIATSVVTRRVQVRFKKDIADSDVNGFFEEIRVKRGEPQDNWYHVDLTLPEPVNPQEFISDLRFGNIVEKVKINMDSLPAF